MAELTSVEDKKFGLHSIDLGFAFHSALRKALDSHQSSLLWNLIHISNFDSFWEIFINALWEKLSDIKKDDKISFHKQMNSAYDTVIKEKFNFGGTSEKIVFRLALEMLEKSELEAIWQFIFGDEDEISY